MLNMFYKLKNKKGFTLIELLVVLAVLAIIALIAVPKFTGIKTQAKADADKTTANLIKHQLELAVAAGDVTLPTGDAVTICTFASKNASGVTVTVPASTPPITSANLDKYIDNKSENQSGTTFTFKVDKTGKITY